jgi:hypothetical protein
MKYKNNKGKQPREAGKIGKIISLWLSYPGRKKGKQLRE